MALTLALFQKIGALSVMIILGFISVRFHILKYEDSKVLSRFALYFLTPCAMLDAFQYQFSPDKLAGMGISLLGSLVTVLVFALLSRLLRKPCAFRWWTIPPLNTPTPAISCFPLLPAPWAGTG